MKLADLAKKVTGDPVLKDASFGVADGCLCIIGAKPDGRFWHVPVFRVENVSREAVGAKFETAFDAAVKEALRWVVPVKEEKTTPAPQPEAAAEAL